MRLLYLGLLTITLVMVIWIFFQSNFTSWYLIFVMLTIAFLHAFLFKAEFKK